MMFGHFDVSREYLIKSYVEEHSKNVVSDAIKDKLDAEIELTPSKKSTAGDLVGDFIDKVKKNGAIFSGHIHGRKEFISKGRNFILIGDPYQQNMGERDYSCGFYVLDSENKYSFCPIDSVPKHIDLKMSTIVKDIDAFDFSIVKGNIIHKTYDVEVSVTDDAKISQKITDWQPYEELLPDYDVQMPLTSALSSQNQSIELIRKSKMDYVKNYIQNID